MDNSQERIAIFLPALYGGGAERTILKLAGGLISRGYSVDLILARAKGAYLSEIPKKVRVVDLNVRRDLLSLAGLVGYLRRTQPTVLLSALHTNIVAILAKKVSGVSTRVIVSERNTFSNRVAHFSSDFRMRLMPKLIQYFYPSAESVVAVSHGVADDLVNRVGIPAEHVTVIYNPVVTPELRIKAGCPIDHPWFKPGQPPVILSVGRLSIQKDFATLISAFARIRKTNDTRLMILGEGEERNSLESQISQLGLEPYVCLPGFVSNPYPYMRDASVFVLSSKYEGLPGVLIEALFCGPPLVATDCPSGPREILCGGDYGQLVPVGDPESLAQAIRKALASDVAPPPEESWRRFELDVVVNQYLSLFFGMDFAHRQKLQSRMSSETESL